MREREKRRVVLLPLATSSRECWENRDLRREREERVFKNERERSYVHYGNQRCR